MTWGCDYWQTWAEMPPTTETCEPQQHQEETHLSPFLPGTTPLIKAVGLKRAGFLVFLPREHPSKVTCPEPKVILLKTHLKKASLCT